MGSFYGSAEARCRRRVSLSCILASLQEVVTDPKKSSVLKTGDLEKEAAVEVSLLAEDSPYAEVRVAVKPYDDPETPVNTVRAWVIGFITCTIVTACNVLLSLRRSPVSISPTVVQLISYPMGKGWHAFMPNWKFRLFGHHFEFNPEAPFNMKEHTVIVIMTAAGSALSYALDILLAQELFYDQHFGWGFQILLILSTQAMGFGLAGVMRRFLIWPAAMVWPATVSCLEDCRQIQNRVANSLL